MNGLSPVCKPATYLCPSLWLLWPLMQEWRLGTRQSPVPFSLPLLLSFPDSILPCLTSQHKAVLTAHRKMYSM